MEHLWKVVFLIVLFVFVPRWLWSQETKTKLALLNIKEEAIGMPIRLLCLI